MNAPDHFADMVTVLMGETITPRLGHVGIVHRLDDGAPKERIARAVEAAMWLQLVEEVCA